MTGSSFHWFVAWRYLMARPRRVSAAIFLVAGTLCIASAAASFIGNLVFRPEPERAFVSFGAAELLQCLALGLLAQAGMHVLWGLFGYCRRAPGRLAVPFLSLAALFAIAVGALTHGVLDGTMSSVSTGLLVLAIPLLLAVLAGYWRDDRVSAIAVLSSTVLLLAAAYVTLVLSRSFFTEDVPFPSHPVLARGLGAWIVSMVVVEVVVVTQVLRHRASRSALVAPFLLAACALYAHSASAPAEPDGFSAEASELSPQAGDPVQVIEDAPETRDTGDAGAGEAVGEPAAEDPAGEGAAGEGLAVEGGPGFDLGELPRELDALVDEADAQPGADAPGAPDGDSLESRLFAHAFALTLGGLGLFGLGVFFGLLGVVLAVMEHLRGHGRMGVRLPQISVTLAALGVTVAVAGLIVQFGSEPFNIFTARSAPQQPFMLTAVALLALGELALILGAIRYVFTFFTTVSVAGVTIGSMALVIVLSVMSGFEIDLRNKILGSNAHVLITKEEGAFTEYRDIAARIGNIPGVVAQTPYLTSEVVIAANSNYANVIIKGVDPDTVGSVTELGKNTQQPRALERLYPLADDGGVVGPPRDAGAEPAPARSDGGTDTAGEGVDPPPEDMELDWDQPADFSGGTGPEEDAPASGAGEVPPPPGSGTAAEGDGDIGADPPPADMDVRWDAPQDFSGDAETDGAGDAVVAPEPPILDLDPGDEAGDDGATGRDEPARRKSSLLDEDDDAVPELRVSPRVARLPGVLVGKELVKNLHLYVGQEVRIISPLAEDTPAGPVPRTRYLRVAGTFFTGMYEYDFKLVYVALSTLQSFLDLQDEVGGIEIRVSDPLETGPVLQEIRAALPPGYRVQDWKEINRNLFSALKLEKIAMFLVLAIIILVASFSIVSNLIMVVVEKAKEIALLKTLGATDASVVSIFVAQGFFIGLVGMLIGVTHGLVACYLGKVYGLPLDPEVYYIDQLPIHVESLAVIAVAVAGVAISVVATLYPAFMAARLRPMEGLRYD